MLYATTGKDSLVFVTTLFTVNWLDKQFKPRTPEIITSRLDAIKELIPKLSMHSTSTNCCNNYRVMLPSIISLNCQLKIIYCLLTVVLFCQVKMDCWFFKSLYQRIRSS